MKAIKLNVKPLMVEVARLNVHPGDVVVVTATRDLTREESGRLGNSLADLSRQTEVQFVMGHRDFSMTVIAKKPA